MANHRTPTEKANATGAAKNHPARFRGRAAPPNKRLGRPSRHLSGNAVVAWEAFLAEIPWLMEGDRAVVEMAAIMRGKLLDGEDIGVTAIGLYRQMIKDMGGTPVDRTRITAPDEGDQGDPAAAYLS